MKRSVITILLIMTIIFGIDLWPTRHYSRAYAWDFDFSMGGRKEKEPKRSAWAVSGWSSCMDECSRHLNAECVRNCVKMWLDPSAPPWTEIWYEEYAGPLYQQ